MAKSKSKKPGKARNSDPVVSAATPKKASIPRGVRKHLRQLERQLSDAARQEHKRLRKLERATFRRQMLQAALEELRGETAIPVALAAVEALASAVATTPAAARPAAKTRSAAKVTAAAAPRPAAKPSPAARPRPAAKFTAAATPRPAAKPSPAARPRPAAVRTRTARATTASAKAAPKATPESPTT